MDALQQMSPGVRIALVIIDMIVSVTAQVLPLNELVPLMRGYGAINILIDGAHAPGNINVSLRSLLFLNFDACAYACQICFITYPDSFNIPFIFYIIDRWRLTFGSEICINGLFYLFLSLKLVNYSSLSFFAFVSEISMYL